MKKIIPALVAIVLIILIVGVSLGVQIKEKYSYSTEKADLEEYFDLEDDEDTAIILGDEILEEKAILRDGIYYFSSDFVKTYFNKRFYEDEGEGLVLYALSDDIVRTEIGSSIYTEGEAAQDAGYVIAFYEGDKLYLACDYVQKFTNMYVAAYEEPNRMQIYTENYLSTGYSMMVSKDSAIRYQGGIKSDVLKEVDKGTIVSVLEEMENWNKVKSADGIIGYIEKKHLSESEEKDADIEAGYTASSDGWTGYAEAEYSNQVRDHKINMAWHQVMTQGANETLEEYISGTSGLNVISPTWFSLSDNEGNFSSIASTDYVEKAHKAGMEVWALIDNFSNQVDTYSVLSSTAKRTYLIEGLMQTASASGIDGINIDFEQLTPKTGEHFVEFIRELSVSCRANELVLSIDNYVPAGNTNFYDRAEQGRVADYVIIMGYDEHWAGSEEAGSVASIDFVEDGILKTLEEVPAEKIINGIPFYTRIWRTEGTTVSSDAVGMNAAEQFLSKRDVTAQWDEETCQNYAAFEEGGALYQVWLEDEQSIQVKLNVMANHGIAGVAAWKLGFERPAVWNVIDGYIHG